MLRLLRLFLRGRYSKPARAVRRSLHEIERLVKQRTGVPAEVHWMGMIGIESLHCQIWLKVQSDSEQDRVDAEDGLIAEIRRLVIRCGYPPDAPESIRVCTASEETVQRVAGGNWYVYLNK